MERKQYKISIIQHINAYKKVNLMKITRRFHFPLRET